MQRRLRGWSQEDVAAGLCRVATSLGETDLGVDATMISRWERGMRRPRPRYVRLLSQLFDLPAEQLGLVPDAELADGTLIPYDRVEGDETERLEFVQRMVGLLSVAALPPSLPPAPADVEEALAEAPAVEAWERLERALERPGSVDTETVEHLESVTHALESLEPTAISSRHLLGPATGQLNVISALLQAQLPSTTRARLCSLAGETAGLLGWLRWNLSDSDRADAYFHVGLRAAREADDSALGAYLTGAVACRPPMRYDPHATLQMLTSTAFGFSQADASPATRAWLAAKEADAWAQLGRETECLQALDRAADIVERLDGNGPDCRPRFTMVSRNWLAGERGASLVKLGHLTAAQSILPQVLAALGPTSERDRLWLLATLAGAHAGLQEPEEASRLARSALMGAARLQLAPVVHLVVDLRRRLEPHRRNPAVQALDEELRGLGQLPPPALAPS